MLGRCEKSAAVRVLAFARFEPGFHVRRAGGFPCQKQRGPVRLFLRNPAAKLGACELLAQRRRPAFGLADAPRPFRIGRAQEIVEDIGRRLEMPRERVRPLGGDVEAVQPVEPDELVIGGEQDAFPLAMRLGGGERGGRPDENDPRPE